MAAHPLRALDPPRRAPSPTATTPTADVGWLLSGLTGEQHDAVTSSAAPLCVLAGAGSGKTKVLTHRVAYRAAVGTADPSRTLALTFTRKAAGQLRSRLGALGLSTPVAAGTFHAVAFAQLRQIWADHGQRPTALLERSARLLGPMVGAGTDVSHHRMVAELAAEIAWAKTRGIGPDAYVGAAEAAGRHPSRSTDAVAELFTRYEAEKRRRRVLDFDDVLLRCAEAIEHDPQIAATQRWRWRHLFVDEYQDLNPAHARLIDAWLGASLDLCVVGDPHQAIYEWNGSDPSLLTGFSHRYPSAEVIALSENFRSSAGVIAVAGAVLGGIMVPAALRREGPVPVVRTYATDTDEAAGITQAVRDLHAPGTSWSRLAVLARTNAQLVVIGTAMAAAGVPHRVHGGRPLVNHPALASILAAPEDRPARSLEGEFRLLLAGESSDDAESDNRPDLSDGATSPPRMSPYRLPQVRAWQAGLRALREYLDLDRSGTIAGFAGWLASSDLSWEDTGGTDAVVLSSFHRAKGLEWPVVFVAGLEDGLVPLTRASSSPPVAEERRLLYVALTRAETELHCSWARQRRFGTRMVERSASPFLASIEDTIASLAAHRRTIDPRPGLRSLRQELRMPPSGEGPAGTLPGCTALLDDLRSWRATMARTSRVAPGAVIPDRTLALIATCSPRDQADLVTLAGLGPVTARRLGPALLAMVARHTVSAPADRAGQAAHKTT